MGKDFNLKIADFDTAYVKGDGMVLGNGSRNYRAPEFVKGTKVVPKQADIYSLGICLFVMRMGMLPYVVDTQVNGKDLFKLFHSDKAAFWRAQRENSQHIDSASDDLKDLFIKMTWHNPEERLTLEKLSRNKWVNGEIYTEKELKSLMMTTYGLGA